MNRILYRFLIICFVLTIVTPINAKPVLLISHPAQGFMNSIIYLQQNKILVKTDFVFLIHEKEKELKKKLLKLLKKENIHKYKIHLLEDINQEVFKQNDGRFFRNHLKEFQYKTNLNSQLPSQWEKIFRKIFNETDGYIIPGGLAIPAKLYGEKTSIFNKSGAALRAFYESAYLRFLLNNKRIDKKPDYLIFGICYGCQLLNISLNGKLHQSISHEIYNEKYMEDSVKKGFNHLHKNTFKFLYPETEYIYPGWFHEVKFNTKYSKYFKPLKKVMVLSNHKQAIKKTGINLEITGTSVDGLIPEFIQNKKYKNVFGIQSHPERKYLWERMKNLNRETLIFHKYLWNNISKTLIDNHSKRND